MPQLSGSLTAKLAQLRAAPVRFSESNQCFVLAGKRVRGLTEILSHLVTVPKVRRQADTIVDEPIVAEIAKHKGALVRQCGHCDAVVKWAKNTTDVPTLALRLRDEKNTDRAHGIVVDYQLSLYVRLGWTEMKAKCRTIDPCVGTLIEALASKGLALIAAQTPIYDPRTGLATAIDGLITDLATRRKLIILELKSVRSKRVKGAESDLNYECARGITLRGPLAGLEQSYLMRHQLQLLAMCDSVKANFPFKFDNAMLLRVSPGIVRSYKLAPRVAKRAANLIEAIALETGKKKRKSKKRATDADDEPAPKRKK